MRGLLLTANVLAPLASAMLVWAGHPWWGLAALIAVHAPTLWATLYPYCPWWGAQTRHFVTQKNEVWLTIDDGPDPEDTPVILDALRQHDARATFFVIGAKAARWPELVRRIVAEGHTVANHTQTHPQYRFWSLLPGALAREIDACNAALHEIVGHTPRLFRAPAGMRNMFLHPLLARRSLRLVSWSARGLDGRDCDRARIVQRVLAGARPGAILLLHEGRRDPDGRSIAQDCLPRVIRELTANGYRLVIPDLPPDAAAE